MVRRIIALVAHWWIGGLAEKESALTAPQIRRGAFLNTGSKDIGRDPQWDFSIGQYKKDAGYYAIFQEEQEQQQQQRQQIQQKGQLNRSTSTLKNQGEQQEQKQQQQQRKKLPEEFHTIAAEDLRTHEKHLRDFALGKVKQNGQPTQQ
jgi:hypothetical protein